MNIYTEFIDKFVLFSGSSRQLNYSGINVCALAVFSIKEKVMLLDSTSTF